MRLPTWLRTKSTRRASQGMVTVTLELDASKATAAFASAARRLEDLQWRNRLRAERTAAKRWWGEYATAAYAAYGWDWPGPVPGTVWARQLGRVSLVHSADPSAPTLVELADGTPLGHLVDDIKITNRRTR